MSDSIPEISSLSELEGKYLACENDVGTGYFPEIFRVVKGSLDNIFNVYELGDPNINDGFVGDCARGFLEDREVNEIWVPQEIPNVSFFGSKQQDDGRFIHTLRGIDEEGSIDVLSDIVQRVIRFRISQG